MLKDVTITNYLGKSVTYSFEGPTLEDQSGLLITEIEGLGPVKATVNMTQLATADGDIFFKFPVYLGVGLSPNSLYHPGHQTLRGIQNGEKQDTGPT